MLEEGQGARDLKFVGTSRFILTICSLYSDYLSWTPAVHWQESFLVLGHFPNQNAAS